LAGKGCTSLSSPELVALDTDSLWNMYLDARERQDEEGKTRVRNALMEKYLPLVRIIALKLLRTMPSSVELDDLVSSGVFGLMDAIGRFDPDRGVRFKSYCSTRIRGSILDQLRSEDWVPRQVRLQASKIDRALKDLGEEYGREATEGELATRLDCDEAELRRRLARSQATRMVSLSGKWSSQDGDGEQMAHTLRNEKAIEPTEVLNEADVLSFITRSLTERERFIILQYYKAGQTMREIGEILQLTESRVCQIHSNVMVRLRSTIDPEQARILLSA
jgi:RNA polymerase sigma factor for flagellar operon FliA